MPYNITVGRNEDDRKKFADKGTVFIGKHYVQMGQTTSLSSNVLLDVNTSHVILVSGKRGSGKSYSLAAIAEEMVRLPEEVSSNVSVLMFDTMGIFWTMKYPNTRQEKLLGQWSLKPEGMNVKICIPEGHFESYKEKGVPVDKKFSIKTSELTAGDWCRVFGVDINSDKGVLIQRAIKDLGQDFGINDIINEVKKDIRADKKVKDAVEALFETAKEWGLFSKEGVEVENLLERGSVTILDLSPYTEVSGSWSIKGLVIGILSRKLLNQRILSRKEEEVENIESEGRLFSEDGKEQERPLVWLIIDEAHEFLARDKETPATDALVQILREGRQPGISLILATQQPGEIHKDVLTQTDIVISHRLTSRIDIEALNSMMQTYHYGDIQKFMNLLPRVKGSAIILDDNSE
ncbi:MAG: DUF87 domain-containing protein, partial [Nanoarchaeota archaeon]